LSGETSIAEGVGDGGGYGFLTLFFELETVCVTTPTN
jgi:hypothetical protein